MIPATSVSTFINPSLTSAMPADLSQVAGKMTSAQVDQASKDFESMFVGQMLEQMFGESVGSQAFGNDDTNEIYKSLMMDAYGKEISRSGGIGIASYVKRELLKLQEKK